MQALKCSCGHLADDESTFLMCVMLIGDKHSRLKACGLIFRSGSPLTGVRNELLVLSATVMTACSVKYSFASKHS